jgi:hypothetical protein
MWPPPPGGTWVIDLDGVVWLAGKPIPGVDEAVARLRGIRAPGTGLPNVIAVGTRRGDFGKDFAAVHGKGPAVVVELAAAAYGRLVVTADDAAARATSIARAAGKT